MGSLPGSGRTHRISPQLSSVTEVGVRADLTAHALGRLLVSSPLIFDMLSTRDIRHLRRADTAVRSLVAEHSWSDSSTLVRSLTQWRSSFPAATAAFVDAAALSKPQLAHLSGLTSFGVLGYRSKDPAGEHPLAFVRNFLRLEALRIELRATGKYSRATSLPFTLSPSAPVWRELGGLRELSLALPQSCYPPDFLSHLGGIRKLNLTAETSMGPTGSFTVTDVGLGQLAGLEELHLKEVAFSADFTGACFARLPRLVLLDLCSAALPCEASLPPLLVSLSVRKQLHLSSATIAPLTSLKSLCLGTCSPPPAASVCLTQTAFLGLAVLETFEVARGVFASDSDEADVLALLLGFGRLRRLAGSMIPIAPVIARVSTCPIVELSVQFGRTAVVPAAFAGAFPHLRSLNATFPTSWHEPYAYRSDLKPWKDCAPFGGVSGLWVRISSRGVAWRLVGGSTPSLFALSSVLFRISKSVTAP